jgi:hypothetical protein
MAFSSSYRHHLLKCINENTEGTKELLEIHTKFKTTDVKVKKKTALRPNQSIKTCHRKTLREVYQKYTRPDGNVRMTFLSR